MHEHPSKTLTSLWHQEANLQRQLPNRTGQTIGRGTNSRPALAR